MQKEIIETELVETGSRMDTINTTWNQFKQDIDEKIALLPTGMVTVSISYDWEDGLQCSITHTREETDEEYQARTQALADKQKTLDEQTRKAEHALYLRLHKKYGEQA